MADEIDRAKRNLLGLLLRPFKAGAESYRTEGVTAPAPPPQRRVIRDDREALLALLGPLAGEGHTPFGYTLSAVRAGPDRVEFDFAREGFEIRVRLAARDGNEGDAWAESRSFRIFADGNGPQWERDLVVARVAQEITLRDHGQLWIPA